MLDQGQRDYLAAESLIDQLFGEVIYTYFAPTDEKWGYLLMSGGLLTEKKLKKFQQSFDASQIEQEATPDRRLVIRFKNSSSKVCETCGAQS